MSTASPSSQQRSANELRAFLKDIALHLRANVEIRDRTYHFRTYKQCFLGSEGVDCLVKAGFARSRRSAVHLGRFLASEYDVFEHVCKDHEFKDRSLFFRFVDRHSEKAPQGKFVVLSQTTTDIRALQAAIKAEAAAPKKPLPTEQTTETETETPPSTPPEPRPELPHFPAAPATGLRRSCTTNTFRSLNFDGVGVCGREKQVQFLKDFVRDKLERKINNDHSVTYTNRRETTSKSAVLVEGKSGCGKLELVNHLLKHVKGKHRGEILVGSGMFEEKSDPAAVSVVPFHAITQAVEEIVDALLLIIYKGDADEGTLRSRWKGKLREGMGGSDASLQVLLTLIPRLGSLLLDGDGCQGFVSSDDEAIADDQEEYQFAFDGLKAAFRDLFRVISSEFAVILSLHNLQWADKESVLLLQALLEDSTLQSESFIFMGTLRPVEENAALDCFRVNGSLNATSITLDNLDVDGVAEIVNHLLKVGRDASLPLATIIHNKTKGSQYFVIQFIRELEQRGIISYSFQKRKWEFDLESVFTKMDFADNVADVLAQKIRSLKETQQQILIVASALGKSEFEKRVMEQLLISYRALTRKRGTTTEAAESSPSGRSKQAFGQALFSLVQGGFLATAGSPGKFRFAHENVRQAGLMFLPRLPEQRKRLFLCLGRQLKEMAQESDEEVAQLVFQSVGLLNQAQELITTPQEREQLAHFNYKAAVLASERSSFFPASIFLSTAITMISSSEEEAWNKNYGLMLQITDLRITVEFRCGRLDKSNDIADEVLVYANSFEDKKHAYFGKMLALMQQGKCREARQLAINVLALLGVKIPTKIVDGDARQAMERVQELLRGRTDDDLMDLRQLTDSNALSILQFLERLAELCFTARSPDYMTGMLCLALPLETTLKHGNSQLSCISYAQFAMMCMIMGMTSEAHRFGELSLRFVKECPGVTRYDCRAQNLYNYYVGHWRYSFQSFIEPMGSVLNQYWQKGVLENYFVDVHAYVEIYISAGLDLDPIRRDIERIAEQMRDNQRVQALHNAAPLFQLVSNLVGCGSSSGLDLTEFHGDYFVPDLEEEWRRKKSLQPLQKMYFSRMMHAYLFNLYKEANEWSQKIWSDGSKAVGTSALILYQVFYRGMVAFAVAQKQKHNQLKRQQYRKAGKEVIKKFVAWVESGNVNAHHLLLLLQAEEHATKRSSREEVQEAYDFAISAAARLGFLHSRAIGNERAGLYFLKEGDSDWAATYLRTAIESYEEWGAQAKVAHINMTHRRLLRRKVDQESLRGVFDDGSTRYQSDNESSERRGQKRLAVSRLNELSTETHHSLDSMGVASASSDSGGSLGEFSSDDVFSDEEASENRQKRFVDCEVLQDRITS